MTRYELSASPWRKIEELLPGRPGWVGGTAREVRLFVKGVPWVLRGDAGPTPPTGKLTGAS
jgi:hypothetical protein